MSKQSGPEGPLPPRTSDNLSVAAGAACFLANTVAIIRELAAKGANRSADVMYADLDKSLDAKEDAIRAVMTELREARGLVPVRFGSASATTAHEIALEMVLALMDEQCPGPEHVEVGGKSVKPIDLFEPWKTWPDANEVMAVIRLEETQARKARRKSGKGAEADEGPWSEPRNVSQWAKVYGKINRNTMSKRLREGVVRCKPVGKLYMIAIADLPLIEQAKYRGSKN